MKLATYNIHACVGGDGRFDPQRIVRVLKEIDADVVALQEVEHRRVEGQDLLDYLAAAVGLTAIAGPTLLRGPHDYGNALLTRLPILRVNRIDLSVADREPRGALDASLAWGRLRAQVVATHLGLRPGERRWQIRRLLTLFESAPADLTVLLGDLNEWLLWGRPLRWLRRHFAVNANPLTYPARFPLFALDRIWVRPLTLVKSLEVHDSPAARMASDHLPLKALLRPDPIQKTANPDSDKIPPLRKRREGEQRGDELHGAQLQSPCSRYSVVAQIIRMARGPSCPVASRPLPVSVREGYWSSTTSTFEPDWAWALYAEHGGVGVGQKAGRHFHVWAVRDRRE